MSPPLKSGPNLIPSWKTLRGLGANSVVRSANVWAVLVPVAARLLAGIEEVVTVTLFGTTLTIHFGLPFSWKVLFVGAMAFLLANVVYAVFCPRIIKETANYREFADQRQSGVELMSSLEQAYRAGLIANTEADPLLHWFRTRHAGLTSQYVSTSGSLQPDDKVFAEAYALTVEALGNFSPLARSLATALYAVGLSAVSVVLWQNVAYVASHW